MLFIDELDKSNIDLPNDLLHVLENGSYDIPELVRRCTGGMRARIAVRRLAAVFDNAEDVETRESRVVVIISNGEREFPAAFRRRCLALEMRTPPREQLLAVVKGTLKSARRAEDLVGLSVQRVQAGGSHSLDQLLKAVQMEIWKAAHPLPAAGDGSVPVPVLSLKAGPSLPGPTSSPESAEYAAPCHRPGQHPQQGRPAPRLRAAVRRFFALATPTARRLASQLAAIHFKYNLVGQRRRRTMPQTNLDHLAKMLMGGPIDWDSGVEGRPEFADGVREALLATTTASPLARPVAVMSQPHVRPPGSGRPDQRPQAYYSGVSPRGGGGGHPAAAEVVIQ
ncbi:hypothetical protein ACFWHV_21725 [Streptomyces collinus]|uniref:hypothetical protein n=1 Tax=Streptomyces collinus TaxID=42684 RepID=UPI00365329BC